MKDVNRHLFRGKFPRLIFWIIIFSMVFAGGSVLAVTITNSGFESDLAGWNVSGTVTSSPSGIFPNDSFAWTVTPYETRMAKLEPSGNQGVFSAAADVLGLSADSRSYLQSQFPVITNMAYLYTDISLAVGESFSMAWNYVANDYAPFNDASFCSLVNLDNPTNVPMVNGYSSQVGILGATVLGTGNYSTGSYGSTGWQVATFKAANAGQYRLGFAVYNLDDTMLSPFLFVDKAPGTTLKDGVPFAPIPPDDNPPPPPADTAPAVTTGSASSITTSSAIIAGSVTKDGGDTVTERGVVYSPASNPTTDDGKVISGNGIGSFSASIAGLAAGTTYHARAYAINAVGTAYGEDVTFVTIPASPSAIDATNILATAFTANWISVSGATGYRLDVATDNAFSQIVSGYMNLSVGNGSSYSVTGLSPVTPYYFRVRASNSNGSSSDSNVISVTTVKKTQSINFPSITDKTYGDPDFTPIATATSGLAVTLSSSEPNVATIVDNQIHIVGFGTTEITVSQSGNDTWIEAASQKQTLLVNKKALTIGGALIVDDRIYNGQAAASVQENELTLVGVLPGDDIHLNPVAVFSDKNASPDKAVHLTAATNISGDDAINYQLSLTGAPSGIGDISRRPIAITINENSKTYGGQDPFFTFSLSSGTLLTGDSITGAPAREKGENVGTYAFTKNKLTAGPNYEITITNGFVITPYHESMSGGSIRNGEDDENDGDISFIAEPVPGFGFAYWYDHSMDRMIGTDELLVNPASDLADVRPVFWPMTLQTDKQVVGLQTELKTTASFLDGSVKLILPAHADSEAVLAVTPCDASQVVGKASTPDQMLPVPLYYCLHRSENLNGEVIQIQIALAQNIIVQKNIDVQLLKLYRWNEASSLWEISSILQQGIDIDQGVLWADIDDFSVYGVFHTLPANITDTGETGNASALFRLLPFLLLLLAAGTWLLHWLYGRKPVQTNK